MRFFIIALLILAAPAHAESRQKKADYAEDWAVGYIKEVEGEYWFQNHVCEQECYGESAGYHWAFKNYDRVRQDPSLCETKSTSFNSGCNIYLNGAEE